MGARRGLLSERFQQQESLPYDSSVSQESRDLHNNSARCTEVPPGVQCSALPEAIQNQSLPAEPKCCKTSATGQRRLSFSTAATLNATLTSFLFGFSLGVTNSCMNVIALQFEWCGNTWQTSCRRSQCYQSIINSIVYVGAILGALASNYLIRLGRRLSLQAACSMFVFGGLLGALYVVPEWEVATLMASRIVSGVGLGVVTVVTPIYISEMTRAKDRGFYGAIHQVLIGLGIFVSIAIGLPLTPNSDNFADFRLGSFDSIWWRFMWGFQCLPAIICITTFAFFCTDESPHWSMLNGRTNDAMATVMKIYDADELVFVEEPLIDIARAVTEAKELQSITLMDAMKESFYRYGILLGLFLAVLQQLSGVNVIVSSSNDLFFKAGIQSSLVTWISTGMAFTNVLASLFAAPVVESHGRRRLLLWGLAGQLLATGPVGLIRYLAETQGIHLMSSEAVLQISVAASFLFMIAFSFALGPVVWIYLSEIYPAEIKGPVLSWCGVFNWFSSFIVVFFAKFLDFTQAYLLFSGVCSVGLLFVFLWVIETKGSSINDSPISPRSMRSESSLIQRSMSTSSITALENLRKQIRSSASTPNVCGMSRSLVGVGRAGQLWGAGAAIRQQGFNTEWRPARETCQCRNQADQKPQRKGSSYLRVIAGPYLTSALETSRSCVSGDAVKRAEVEGDVQKRFVAGLCKQLLKDPDANRPSSDDASFVLEGDGLDSNQASQSSTDLSLCRSNGNFNAPAGLERSKKLRHLRISADTVYEETDGATPTDSERLLTRDLKDEETNPPKLRLDEQLVRESIHRQECVLDLLSVASSYESDWSSSVYSTDALTSFADPELLPPNKTSHFRSLRGASWQVLQGECSNPSQHEEVVRNDCQQYRAKTHAECRSGTAHYQQCVGWEGHDEAGSSSRFSRLITSSGDESLSTPKERGIRSFRFSLDGTDQNSTADGDEKQEGFHQYQSFSAQDTNRWLSSLLKGSWSLSLKSKVKEKYSSGNLEALTDDCFLTGSKVDPDSCYVQMES